MGNFIFCAVKLLISFDLHKDYWTKDSMAEDVLRTSLKFKIELLAVNSFRKSSILDVWLGTE